MQIATRIPMNIITYIPQFFCTTGLPITVGLGLAIRDSIVVSLTYIPNYPECGTGCGVKCGEVILRLMFANDAVLMAAAVVNLQCAVLANLH